MHYRDLPPLPPVRWRRHIPEGHVCRLCGSEFHRFACPAGGIAGRYLTNISIPREHFLSTMFVRRMPTGDLVDIMWGALEALPSVTTMNEMISRAPRARVEDL
jgi:hypothetical protein